MAQATESRSSSTAQPNIQDVFLNYARRDRLPVTLHLLDGRSFEARIKNFDRFAVIVQPDEHMHQHRVRLGMALAEFARDPLDDQQVVIDIPAVVDEGRVARGGDR